MKPIDRHHYYAISFLGILLILTIVAVVAIIFNPNTKADERLIYQPINTLPEVKDFLPENPVIKDMLPEI